MSTTTISIADQIIAILEYICGKFGIVIDWTTDTILPYAQTIINHYIEWAKYKSIFWIAVGAFLVIAGVILVILANKYWDTDGDMTFIGMVIIVIGLVLSLIFATNLIKALTFPELSTFEYVKELLKTIGN